MDNDYEKNLDKYLQEKLHLNYKNTHPCVAQNKSCNKGNNCPFVGFPNDICIYYLSGSCNFGDEKCRKRHLPEYRDKYNSAKEDFKQIQPKAKKVVLAGCPCEAQHGKCEFGESCEFLGWPLDCCLHFVHGECKFAAQCKKRHYADLQKKYAEFTQYKHLIDKDMEWMAENTRVCPTCCLPVEKLKGCSHMKCRKCGHDFDWEDMKDANGASNKYIFNQAKKNIKLLLNIQNQVQFQVFVSALDGKSLTFNLPTKAHTNVSILMKQIEAKTGIVQDDQRLIYAGKQLNQNNQLIDYNITCNCTIHLVIRLPGGLID